MTYTLTTDHAASSHGQPVLVETYHSDTPAVAYGPNDWVPAAGSYAHQIAAEMRSDATPEQQILIDKFVALRDDSLVNPFDQFFNR